MKKKLTALLAGAMLIMATSAMAIPISGEINFTGSLLLVGGSSLPTATGIDFADYSIITGTGFGSGIATRNVSGTYASIPTPPPLANAVPVIFKDFTYNPSLNPNPVIDLWTLTTGGNTYSFDMTAISSITATSLTGTGTLHATGYTDTLGVWELTTQNGTSEMSFSAASAVPEPGTMVLLGFGMLGLAIYGKRRMNKEA